MCYIELPCKKHHLTTEFFSVDLGYRLKVHIIPVDIFILKQDTSNGVSLVSVRPRNEVVYACPDKNNDIQVNESKWDVTFSNKTAAPQWDTRNIAYDILV